MFCLSFQIEKLEDDLSGFTNENRLLQQTIQKLEKQVANLHTQNETFERNEESYQEKVNYLICSLNQK